MEGEKVDHWLHKVWDIWLYDDCKQYRSFWGDKNVLHLDYGMSAHCKWTKILIIQFKSANFILHEFNPNKVVWKVYFWGLTKFKQNLLHFRQWDYLSSPVKSWSHNFPPFSPFNHHVGVFILYTSLNPAFISLHPLLPPELSLSSLDLYFWYLLSHRKPTYQRY